MEQSMKITVVGTGYVGLVTAVCIAEKGFKVSCADIDEEKISKLNKGESPLFEPGLAELLSANKEKLSFSTDCEGAYRDCDVAFICVPTPEKKDGSANLRYVFDAALQLAQSVRKNCIAVVKSTVPIGTNDRIAALIKENLAAPVTVEVASNPEFLSQGTAVRDTLNAPRIVIGVESGNAERMLKKIYDRFERPYIVTDRKSAEMIKYACNDFLALKISYINEIANLCEIVGANVEDVSKGMGYDPRIGDKFLMPGIGYGGSCFPKDTKALHWLASFHDYELKTIKAAIEVNENQKIKLIKKARRYYDSFNGLTIAILGLSFKPGTDDLREAPSLQNIPILLEDNARIKAWDPKGTENFKRLYPDGIAYCDTIEQTIEKAGLCLIFTEWDEIRKFDVKKFTMLMQRPVIIDGRNCFSPDAFKDLRVIYESVGRKAINNL